MRDDKKKKCVDFFITFDPNMQFISNFHTATCFLLEHCLQSFIVLPLTVKKLQRKEDIHNVWKKKHTDTYDTEHVLSSFKFRISAFHNALKVTSSLKYSFELSILISILEDYLFEQTSA